MFPPFSEGKCSGFMSVFGTNFVAAFEFLPQLRYGKSDQLHAAHDLEKTSDFSPSKSTLVLGIVGKFPFFFAGTKKALAPRKMDGQILYPGINKQIRSVATKLHWEIRKNLVDTNIKKQVPAPTITTQ